MQYCVESDRGILRLGCIAFASQHCFQTYDPHAIQRQFFLFGFYLVSILNVKGDNFYLSF